MSSTLQYQPSGKPAITGAFYAIVGKEYWSRERFAREMEWMRDMGMMTVIVCTAALEEVAFFPTTVEGMTIRGNRPLESILTEADLHGMTIYLMPYDTARYWHEFSAEYYASLAERVMAMATDLHQQYGHHPSLQGFYLMPEFWYHASDDLRKVWTEHYLVPITTHIKSLDTRYITCTAPFAGLGYTPDGFESFWQRFLNDVPQLDLLMFQDGIGANEWRDDYAKGRTFATMVEMFSRLKNACDQHGRTLWSDLEAFEMVGVLYPPHISRIVAQLEKMAPYVEGFVIWEYSYVSPSWSLPSWHFYFNYLRYLDDMPFVENVARGKTYTFSVPPSEQWPDMDAKLTNGGMREHEPHSGAGWLGQPSVEITLDLGREISGIEALGASFFRRTEWGIHLPTNVQVSILNHTQDAVDLGHIDQPLIEIEDGANLFVLKLDSPARGRYVRFQVTPSGGNNWLFCNELTVYATDPSVVSRGKPYTLSTPPSPEFPNEIQKLTNGDNGGRWYAQCGWENLSSDLHITIDLEATHLLKKVNAYCLSKTEEMVELPDHVFVQTSMDGEMFSSEVQLDPAGTNDGESFRFSAALSETAARYVRFVFRPQDGWLMVNELRVISNQGGVVGSWEAH